MEFQQPLAAFYSYSHKNGRDRRYLEELRDALARSRREKVIDDWDDRKIRTGEEWEDAIIERARQSRVFLLILTDRFIGSDFCVATELTIARALFAKRAAVIAAILAEEADWQIEGLRDLQIVMPSGKPVNQSRDGWKVVGQAVRQLAEELVAGRYFANIEHTRPAIPSLLPFTIGRETVITNFDNALRAAPPHRPFVCILTGERQGQSELISHLLSDGGPVRNILALTAAHYPIEIDGEAWIRSAKPVEALLNDTLASRVEPPPPSADREGIAASLTCQLGLSVVRCELSAAQWRACGASRLQQFLDYWAAGWPTLDRKRPMIVFLSIRAEAGNLAKSGGICLPLPSVTRQSTLAWLATGATRSQFIEDRVQSHLGEVFGTQESLPMEVFAPRLLPFLRRFQF